MNRRWLFKAAAGAVAAAALPVEAKLEPKPVPVLADPEPMGEVLTTCMGMGMGDWVYDLNTDAMRNRFTGEIWTGIGRGR